MDVKVFKMVSGEEYIAELVDETEDHYVIKQPVGMVDQGGGKVGFMPYFVMAKSREFKILKDHFITEPQEPIEEPKENYEQIFGSGIIAPTKKILHG